MKTKQSESKTRNARGRKGKRSPVQYTIRAVPDDVDRALRKQARTLGASLNDVLLNALRTAIGQASPAMPHNNLRKYFGSVPPDPELDKIFDEMRQIDEEKWR